ncbi:MAG: hypothetical protein QGI00_01590 [Candidatus Marinimicrobia bacterium]|nr:hypothetical protein [Candidatus Neomarinimicrobiota bacterium]
MSIAKEEGNSGQKSYDELKSDQWKHRKLSQSWVKYLSFSLEKYHREKYLSFSLEEYHREKNENIYAFPGNPKLAKKHGIKRKEFLFDISVGLYKSFKSKKFESSKKVLPIHYQSKSIWYQSKSIWQIESEFAEDTREIAIDFSKLLAGNADYAMMVSPEGKEKRDYYMDEMKKMLESNVSLGRKILYFLILPHPRDWVNKKREWSLHNWDNNDWKKVKKGEWIIKEK